MKHQATIEQLKRGMVRATAEMEEANGEGLAELEAITTQIDRILEGAGVLEGIRALEARREGAMTNLKMRLAQLQQKHDMYGHAIRVLAELDAERLSHPEAISL